MRGSQGEELTWYARLVRGGQAILSGAALAAFGLACSDFEAAPPVVVETPDAGDASTERPLVFAAVFTAADGARTLVPHVTGGASARSTECVISAEAADARPLPSFLVSSRPVLGNTTRGLAVTGVQPPGIQFFRADTTCPASPPVQIATNGPAIHFRPSAGAERLAFLDTENGQPRVATAPLAFPYTVRELRPKGLGSDMPPFWFVESGAAAVGWSETPTTLRARLDDDDPTHAPFDLVACTDAASVERFDQAAAYGSGLLTVLRKKIPGASPGPRTMVLLARGSDCTNRVPFFQDAEDVLTDDFFVDERTGVLAHVSDRLVEGRRRRAIWLSKGNEAPPVACSNPPTGYHDVGPILGEGATEIVWTRVEDGNSTTTMHHARIEGLSCVETREVLPLAPTDGRRIDSFASRNSGSCNAGVARGAAGAWSLVAVLALLRRRRQFRPS